MSSFKKLNKSDVILSPFTANKRWILTYAPYTQSDSYIETYIGRNVTGSFNLNTDPISNGQYERQVFVSINHLFYQSYSGSVLNTGSLMFDVNTYQSASQQRPINSYFDYNINPNLIKHYPTGSNNKVQVLSVNQNIYGNKILPTSFSLTSSIYLKDDGYGNLVDYSVISGSFGYLSSSYFGGGDIYFVPYDPNWDPVVLDHVGNIFYSQGLVVITNQSSRYSNVFSGSFSLAFQNEHTIYENQVRCVIKESEYNISYNPTLTTNYTSGSLKDFATGSDFYPYMTTIGLYNDDMELLATAKIAKPIMISPNTDMTFIIKYDT